MDHKQNAVRENRVVAIIIIIIIIVIDAVYEATVVNALKFCKKTVDQIVLFVVQKVTSKYAYIINENQKHIDAMHRNHLQVNIHIVKMNIQVLITVKKVLCDAKKIHNALKINA